MSRRLFSVLNGGVQASIQGLGRQHSMRHGVSEGGVMDMHAALWANRLIARDANSPVIEVTLGLLELQFHQDCRFAIAGADMKVSLVCNRAEGCDKALKPWSSYTATKGDRLKFGTAISGLRSYLAISADMQVKSYFGSVSTVLKEQSGGLNGMALANGDDIYGQATVIKKTDEYNQSVPARYMTDYLQCQSQALSLELIPSYQFERFSQKSIETLLNSEYEISNSSNRMAYLLKGEPIHHDIKTMYSEGIAYGGVQIPPDGQPVVLLNERQTMGGYPKLGCITRKSGSELSQSFYPKKVRFTLVDARQAQDDYRHLKQFFANNELAN